MHKLKTVIKKSAFLFFTFYFLLFTFDLTYCTQDKIIAIVNSDCITQKDVNDFGNFMRLQLSSQYSGSELQEKIQSLQEGLLDRLIDDRLILQEAKKNKISADESMIKARVNEIRSQYESEAKFQADLSRQGLVLADIEQRIKEQLLMYKVLEVNVRSKIIVRPQEVTSFYNQNIKEFISPEEREVEFLIAEDEEIANKAFAELKVNPETKDLIQKYPLTVSDMKVSADDKLKREIREAVFNLDVGQISAPVNVNGKFYIFKLKGFTRARQMSLYEAQDRINAYLYDRKMQEILKNWLDELRKKAYIKIL